MKRNRAYYRWHRLRVINRKTDMLMRLGGEEYVEGWTRGKPGRLAKGKIHCSCPMCRRKSYDSPSHSDVKQKEGLKQQILDYGIAGMERRKYK